MSDSSTLGKYRLIAELARGGMGIVYIGISSGVGGFTKLHVIKELKPELVDDPGFVEMFLEEARLAARLNHPNIVPTNEVGIENRRPFLVMEYLEGETLARLLRRKVTAFTLPMHVRVIAEALEGLHYAHTQADFDGTERSVVHRDVSPQNVFITYEGQVRVVDFGIAKASDSTVETRTGIFKGKPGYMAPEQLHGQVDPRVDVFAAGVMLWEAMAGRRMWARKTDVEILTALLTGALPSIDEAAPDAPLELRAICKRAVAADRDQRYGSAKEMRVALDEWLASSGDRSTLRTVGEVLSTAFAEKRAEVRSLIENCIAESRSASTRPRLLSIVAGAEEPSGPSSLKRHPLADPASSSLRPPVGTPSIREMVVGRDVTLPSGEAPPSSYLTPAADVRSLQPPPEPPRRSRAVPVAIVLVLLLVGGGVVFALGRSSVTAPVAAAPPSAAPSAQLGASPPPPSPAPTETEPVPSAAPSASVAASASAPAKAPAVPTHIVYVPVPARPATPPKATSTAAPPAAPPPPPPPATPTKTDCNPPFYFEGTKKVFKPNCL